MKYIFRIYTNLFICVGLSVHINLFAFSATKYWIIKFLLQSWIETINRKKFYLKSYKTYFEILKCILYNNIVLLRADPVMGREKFTESFAVKKESKRERSRVQRKRVSERAERAREQSDISRTYIPFMLLEHAFLAKRNSRGTVRKIGPITARPPCGSPDPRREQYGSRASRFIAERLVNKAPISALFRLSARFAARISRLHASGSG